jgi:hypothetical protein
LKLDSVPIVIKHGMVKIFHWRPELDLDEPYSMRHGGSLCAAFRADEKYCKLMRSPSNIQGFLGIVYKKKTFQITENV